MLDVLDVITASPNWDSFIEWLEAKEVTGVEVEDLCEGAIDVIKMFADKFKTAQSRDDIEQHFLIDLGGDEPLYISPREYTQIYAEASVSLDYELADALADYGMKHLDPKSPHISEINKLLNRLERKSKLLIKSNLNNYKNK
jgi:hypothetical protein